VPDVAAPLTSGVKLLYERSVLVKAYWYLVIGDPPLFTGDQEIVAVPLPGVAVTFVGVAGTVAAAEGVTATVCVGGPETTEFWALS
jgi:hypothetical protein